MTRRLSLIEPFKKLIYDFFSIQSINALKKNERKKIVSVFFALGFRNFWHYIMPLDQLQAGAPHFELGQIHLKH